MSERGNRREVFSWCLFDFANSSFTTVVITVIFSEYFTHRVVGDGGAAWGWTLAFANLLIILSAPVIGAIADGSGNKKKFLLASYLTCIAATAMLFFAGPDRVTWTIFFVVVANFAFSSGENLVAGFLPEIAEPEEIGKISAWGWGIGYIGGLGALVCCLPLVDTGSDVLIRASNLVVTAFFLVGGIPTFLWVRERKRAAGTMDLGASVREGARQVVATWRRRHELPELFRFLTAFLVFSIGVYGVIQFASIIAGTRFELDRAQIVRIFIVSQITAALGALVSGAGVRKFGAVRFVAFTLVLWTLCGCTAILSRSLAGFWVMAVLAGFALGGTLAASRSIVGLFCPEGQSGEIFGFWGLFSRVAALLAPAGWAILESIFGRDTNAGVIYYTASFVVGLAILWGVDEKRGRARVGSEVAPE